MNIRAVLPYRTDESVYIFARPYFLAFLPWFAIGFLLLVIGIFFVFVGSSVFPEVNTDPFAHNIFVLITSAYFLLLVPFLTVAFIDFYYDIHIVTDQRVIDIDQNALFARDVSTLSLDQVQDATARNKGVLSNIFNFGDVVIQTSGAQQYFEFHNVLHPTEIATIVLDLADQAKARLERGEQARLMPRGSVKGVINGELVESTGEMVAMGAILPQVIEAVKNAEAPAASAPTPAQPVPAPAAAPAPAPEPVAQPAEAPTSDLDIVIDEPNKPKG